MIKFLSSGPWFHLNITQICSVDLNWCKVTKPLHALKPSEDDPKRYYLSCKVTMADGGSHESQDSDEAREWLKTLGLKVPPPPVD